MKTVPPTTAEGIERYLGSGFVKGIGPILAKKLVGRVEHEVTIRFDDRLVKYDFGELDEISLAYAITIHKSQVSEFPAVVIPLATQDYMLLQRNLIYTGITRGKRLLVLIGQKKALGIAVRNDRPQRRYSGLSASLIGDGQRSRLLRSVKHVKEHSHAEGAKGIDE
jgi:UvrD-like helicase C-terminal domain